MYCKRNKGAWIAPYVYSSEVVAINADKKYFDEKSGVFRLYDAEPIFYSHGRYFEAGKLIGKFGFSVKKKKVEKK